MCDSRKVCSSMSTAIFDSFCHLSTCPRNDADDRNRFAGSLSSIQLFDFVIFDLSIMSTAEKYAPSTAITLPRETRRMTKSFCWFVVEHPAIWFCHLSTCTREHEDEMCDSRKVMLAHMSSTAIFHSCHLSTCRETRRMTKSFCWFVVEHPAIWFCHLSTCTREHEDEMCDSRKVCSHICPQQYSTLSFLFLEKRGGWQNRFAGSLSSIQLFDFVICRLVRESMKTRCATAEKYARTYVHSNIPLFLFSSSRNEADDKIVLLVRCRASSYLILSFVDLYERAWRRDVRQQKSMLAHMSTDDEIVLLVRCRAFSYLILSSVDMSEKRCRWQNRFAGSLSSIQLFDFVICRLVRESTKRDDSRIVLLARMSSIQQYLTFVICRLVRESTKARCATKKYARTYVHSNIPLFLFSSSRNEADDKIVLLVRCRASSYLILSSVDMSEKRCRWQNRFAGSLSSIQLFDFVICRLVRESMKTRCATAEKYARTYVHSNIPLFLFSSSRNEADDKIVLLVRCRAFSYLILSSVDMSEKRCRWQNRFAGSLSSIQLFDFVICRHVRETMQMTKSFCWFVVDHPAIWFRSLQSFACVGGRCFWTIPRCSRSHVKQSCGVKHGLVAIREHLICLQLFCYDGFQFSQQTWITALRCAERASARSTHTPSMVRDSVLLAMRRASMEWTRLVCWRATRSVDSRAKDERSGADHGWIGVTSGECWCTYIEQDER